MKQTPERRKIIIAGGGTGGHIYPGVAIARAIQRKHPEIEVHFVGSRGGLEEKIVPREGFPLHLIEIGKLHSSVGVVERLRTVLGLPLALLKSWRILRLLRPEAVLGVGGFASGPMVLVSALSGYRSLIWEPNAFPGLANRWLSGFVDECLVVFKDAGKFFRGRSVTQAGLPVRPTMRPHPRGSGEALHILVFGGSQGARAINNIVAACVERGGDWLKGVELVHQTGALDFPRLQGLYRNAPPNVQVFEFLHDMDERLKWADVVVCRAGASTVAEICACEKAAVLIPLPTAADNHQQKNAEVLMAGGAAVMILQKDLTPEKLAAVLSDFRDHRDKLKELEQNVRQFQFPNAADFIAERVMRYAVPT